VESKDVDFIEIERSIAVTRVWEGQYIGYGNRLKLINEYKVRIE
jgi:hypothetical protein